MKSWQIVVVVLFSMVMLFSVSTPNQTSLNHAATVIASPRVVYSPAFTSSPVTTWYNNTPYSYVISSSQLTQYDFSDPVIFSVPKTTACVELNDTKCNVEFVFSAYSVDCDAAMTYV